MLYKTGRPEAPKIISHHTSTRKHAYELCWKRGDAAEDSNIHEIPITKFVTRYRGEWVEVS